MRVQKTLANAVRILLGIGVSVMGAVITTPPSDGAFDSSCTGQSQEDLEGSSSIVALVSPQSMVAGGNTETSEKVVDDCPDGSLPAERCEASSNATRQRDATNEGEIEPIDVLVPVTPGHGGVGDVRLVWVVFWVSVWLALGGHWGRL